MMMFPSFLMILMIHALIDVGVVFPDVDQCQRAVQHWCIVNDYDITPSRKTKADLELIVLEQAHVASGYFLLLQVEEIGCKVNIALFVSLFLQSKLEVLTIICIFCVG
jgi:hypothetical protein